ncbi:hypothetical protein V2G26_015561 [Clonostachys chloroleuca]
MRFLQLLTWAVSVAATVQASTLSTAGVQSLVQRRLPKHADSFIFEITTTVSNNNSTSSELDSYVVSSTNEGKIRVQANSISGLLSGLHKYLSGSAHVDVWWFVGSQLDAAPSSLPALSAPLKGSSIVPWRYHFNTVTTSYTSAFWSWEEWELQLDWMALRSVNLPLAWIGIEKIFIEVFQELGFSDAEIKDFLSGPAFLAWNHFGNIQGSWGGDLPFSWVDDQFELQKKIVKRMVELGMTPILPAFPGFVPATILQHFPNANVSNSSAWERFDTEYTNVTFLDPFDQLFGQLQESFISKQKEHYGNVSSYYALDQFNENSPVSGDTGYLETLSSNTWKTLKKADPDAVWVMQSWLFSSDSAFWSSERIKAFLGGVTESADMLILDLFSESTPLWEKTESYYGKPWIWCQLHDYGHNMGLYGQIMNITINPVQALHADSSTMVGLGLSMEGQEGNEIVYDLLLDQAWSTTPIDTQEYFHDWVSSRYGASSNAIPKGLYAAWEIVRPTVYNNTHLAANAVPKSILELVPSTTGMLNRTGHHPTTLNYDTSILVDAWGEMYRAGKEESTLFGNAAYQHDLVDWTRQVLANAFIPMYQRLIEAYNGTGSDSNQTSPANKCNLQKQGRQITSLLTSLDAVLATNKNFRLSTWIEAARATGHTDAEEDVADFLEYEARTQVTLWGPKGEISDYASKSWAGLISHYYLPRWQRFVSYLIATPPASYNQTVFAAELLKWEEKWIEQKTGGRELGDVSGRGLDAVLREVVAKWPSIFNVAA